MTPPRPLEPVVVDNLWRLRAEPARVAGAAAVWRRFAADARECRLIIDRRAAPISGTAWAGEAADSYHWHRGKIGHDLDEVARLGVGAADALDAVAALLRRGQDLLDDAWRRTAASVPALAQGNQVTFRPTTEAEQRSAGAACVEASAIRRDLDEELGRQVELLRRMRPAWIGIGDAWHAVASGRSDGWKLPAEATDGVRLITIGTDVVLNTGPGDDTVVVRFDQGTGEHVVTVNGVERRLPAGQHLTVRGGAGNDHLRVEPGTRIAFTLIGGDGDDRLAGGGGDDVILSGAGDDTVFAGGGADRVSLGPLGPGRATNEAIDDPRQHETVHLGDGDDRVWGSLGRDSISGGGGDDLIFSGADDDTAAGDDGADTLAAGTGRDRLNGGEGPDVLLGGDERDNLDGGAGDDLLDGGLGPDTVYGASGQDRIFGGEGADYLEGAAGDDTIDGGLGHDVVSGGRGDDTLHGGAGDDVLYAGAGHDRVAGGTGNDRLFGQPDDTAVEIEHLIDVDLTNHGSYIMIVGPAEFVERVQTDLDLLRASPAGQQMLASLEKAHQDSKHWAYAGDGLTISHTSVENGFAHPRANLLHQHPMVQYNPVYDAGAGNAPPVVVLYHELAHVYDYVHGTVPAGRYNGQNGRDVEPDGVTGVRNFERQAVGLPIDHDGDPRTPNRISPAHPLVFTENGLRAELGVPRRDTYGSS